MSWKRALLLPVLAVLVACAEGGIRGSGISTSVVGNVVDVTPDGSNAVGGIRVSIAGTSVSTRTDATGAFSLVGNYEGMVTVRFAPAGGGTAQLPVNVPAAGTLTLNNVRVDGGQGIATAESEDVDFDGVVVSADCPAETLVMDSAVQTQGDVDHYLVDLATSELEDAQGHPVSCEAVMAGAAATLSGEVYADGTFGHALIVLAP